MTPRLELLVDTRRLAALDLHGTSGSRLRMRMVRLEFILSAPLCMAVGGALIATGGWISAAVGAALIGVGMNYLVLARLALQFSRPEMLKTELDGVDLDSELRRYRSASLWVIVPLALVVSMLFRRGVLRRRVSGGRPA